MVTTLLPQQNHIFLSFRKGYGTNSHQGLSLKWSQCSSFPFWRGYYQAGLIGRCYFNMIVDSLPQVWVCTGEPSSGYLFLWWSCPLWNMEISTHFFSCHASEMNHLYVFPVTTSHTHTRSNCTSDVLGPFLHVNVCWCLLFFCRPSLSRFLSSSCWILLEGWSIWATKTSSIGIWLLATACEFFQVSSV